MEDRPWEIACVDRITGESRTLAYGESGEFGLCNQPQEYKVRRSIFIYSSAHHAKDTPPMPERSSYSDKGCLLFSQDLKTPTTQRIVCGSRHLCQVSRPSPGKEITRLAWLACSWGDSSFLTNSCNIFMTGRALRFA